MSGNGLPLFINDGHRQELHGLFLSERTDVDLTSRDFLAAWLDRHIRVEGGKQAHP